MLDKINGHKGFGLQLKYLHFERVDFRLVLLLFLDPDHVPGCDLFS
jgi:hypothetical protein